MNWLRKMRGGFRALFNKEQLDREMSEEMRAHIEMQTQENIGAGMEAEEARYAALRQFGTVGSLTERCREERGLRWLDDLLQDVRFGLRQLGKSPGFTAVAIATLALGIGSSTAIYNVVENVLFNPLPGPEPKRVMEVVEQGENGISPDVLASLRGNRDLFSDVMWFHRLDLKTRTDDFSDWVRGEMVSPNFFSFWRARPLLGRTFGSDEGVPLDAQQQPERDSVIVLSYAWWQSRFGGDAGLIGKTVELSGHRFTVVGVMPPHFHYPQGWSLSFWLSAQQPRPPFQGRSPGFRFLVRLKPDVDRAQAQAMLDILAERLGRERAAAGANAAQDLEGKPGRLRLLMRAMIPTLTAGRYYGADDLPRTLYSLLGAIAFVLLIVCLNLANLTLARTERRRQELGIRAALGAGHGRLARQLVTEAVLLSGLGGLAGLAVTVGFTKLLLLLFPPNMPRLKAFELDGHALGFELLVCAATGVVFGLAATWRANCAGLNETLKEAGTGVTAGRSRSVYRNALVVAEVALSLVLLAGAGLMIQSVVRLLRVYPGFDPAGLLYVNLWLPSKYSDADGGPNARAARNALLARLREELAALPDVQALGIWGGGFGEQGNIQPEGRMEPLRVSSDGCGVEEADLFRAMRIPLRAGRYLDREDVDGQSDAALINESMARLCWPGENPLGRKFRQVEPPNGNGEVYQVVGIVADVRAARYTQGVAATFYRAYQQADFGESKPPVLLVVRAGHEPRRLVLPLLRRLHTVEPGMVHPRIQIARQELDDSTRVQRTYMCYLVGFAGVGLLLAALGIYGVLAYSVARRTRELGIRLALGGQRRDVLGMVMWEGARLVLTGAGLGLVSAFWLLQVVKHLVFQVVRTSGVEEGPVTQLLKYQLFQAGSANPVVWLGAVLLLLVIALLACWLPAARAARTDPMAALRCE